MTYPLIATLGLAIAACAAIVLLAVAFRRTPRVPRSRVLIALLLTTVLMLALTALFDNLMISAGLFHYAPSHLLGVSIGVAPVEDFAYPLAGALLLPAAWLALQKGGSARREDFRQLVVASRPISWINTAFPFAAAYVLTTREIDAVLLIGFLYFLVPYNFAMYGINDVFDYASDVANPRKGGVEGALLPRRLHTPTLWIAALTNIPFLVLLALAGGPAVWSALAVSAFAVVAYSAPGLRFKERPFLDSLTSSTHFVSPAVVGLLLAGADLTGGILLLLSAFFLWGMAAHAFGAVQDIVPDRAAGIHSIATVIGAKATVRVALALWTAAGLLMLAVPWPGPLAAIIAVPYLLNCAPFWSLTDERSAESNRAWRRFIALNYFSGFLVTLLLILEWNSA
ncbi:prenyltransferase [Microbacterium esteraromaticum]|uniref:prenyltransferase n=1 Tax=Microbacterium esteraromaticum TaxID=57043 RepID=UPI001C95A051|nr:prenyltransferase [Microbacterium esteraromaticum]MBY6061324.1 prenyltransferase [Microbacterium esteraromaticum]